MSGALPETALTIAHALLGLALLAAFLRLARGPSLADRAVALDVIAAAIVAVAVTHALSTGLAVFIDVALAIALVTFLGTLALARCQEESEEER